MKANNRIIMMVMCVVLSLAARAQSSHWQYDANAYQYDMTVFYSLEYKYENVTDLTTFEVAAFCGEECRGIGEVQTVSLAGGTVNYGYIRVRSNQSSGEEISFKVYHKALEVESSVAETLTFQSEKLTGMPSNPMKLTIEDPVVRLGDVNGDGSITAQDASLVLQIVAGKLSPTSEGIVYSAADVNSDGSVTAQDASLILQNIAGKVNW